MFGDFLEWAPTRDPDAPEIDFYSLTLADEIKKLRLTPSEKDKCLAQYKVGNKAHLSQV